MKWKKLGHIFDPTEHRLPNNCREFAQSPQTLVFDNFVRVYFSTREKDAVGKYLSHVAFAEFSKDFKTLHRVSSDTVIPLGDLGCFDEHGIFPVNILRDGNRVLAYTTGWNRKVSVSADSSIGLAISTDNGSTFKKHGNGPVLTSSLHEPFLVADGFVLKIKEYYHMWYIYGTKWSVYNKEATPDRVYKIGHALSADGITWKKDDRQIINDSLQADECQALPTVISFDDRYHMWFCYRQPASFRRDKNSAYRIGYAYSDDLKEWIRNDMQTGIDVSETGWDSDMQCYPHVFRCDDKIYMLYNGNEFGRRGFGLAVLEN
ncbi:MAG: hypothetical protein PHI73_02345 [Patescibacteria group bacterium]|nr:hypothetical protein [Patescibacteria group bacterium]